MPRVKLLIQRPEKDLNDMDLVTLPEREFKIKMINIIMEVWKDIQERRNEFRLEIQSLKSTTGGIKSTLDVVEETVNEIETREEGYKKLRHREKKGSLKMKEY